MEIPTANGQPFQEWGHVLQMPGNYMADALAAFQVTAHLQELRVDQDPPLAFGQVVPDHYVDHAEFVFKGHEHHTAGRSWTLPADHQAHHSHRTPRVDTGQGLRTAAALVRSRCAGCRPGASL
jgi:hypothetical protein